MRINLKIVSILFISFFFIGITKAADWSDLGVKHDMHVWYKLDNYKGKVRDGEYIQKADLIVKIKNESDVSKSWDGKVVKLKIPNKYYLGTDLYSTLAVQEDSILTLAPGEEYLYSFGRITCKQEYNMFGEEDPMKVSSWVYYYSMVEYVEVKRLKEEKEKQQSVMLHTPTKIEGNIGVLSIKNGSFGDKMLIYIDGALVEELKFRKYFTKNFTKETTIKLKVTGKKTHQTDEIQVTIKPGYKYFYQPNTALNIETYAYMDRLLQLWNMEVYKSIMVK